MPADPQMADSENPFVDRHERAGDPPSVDQLFGKPHAQQLTSRHHAVLLLREHPNHLRRLATGSSPRLSPFTRITIRSYIPGNMIRMEVFALGGGHGLTMPDPGE
jgi:hypothetical protein